MKKGEELRPYTKEEDDVIIQCVKDYPTNLLNAFNAASKELNGRGFQAVRLRWYQYLKKREDVKAVTCGSKAGFTQNVKNIARDKEGNMPNQHLKHYMFIMKELLELKPKERQLIINFFSGDNTVNQ